MERTVVSSERFMEAVLNHLHSTADEKTDIIHEFAAFFLENPDCLDLLMKRDGLGCGQNEARDLMKAVVGELSEKKECFVIMPYS